jgi:ABC-type transporter Mla maintaining outer membrane lipid asymmetry ATPase subunit MlaF
VSRTIGHLHLIIHGLHFCRILFLHEGKVVWEGPTAEFDTSINPIVRQVSAEALRIFSVETAVHEHRQAHNFF